MANIPYINLLIMLMTILPSIVKQHKSETHSEISQLTEQTTFVLVFSIFILLLQMHPIDNVSITYIY